MVIQQGSLMYAETSKKLRECKFVGEGQTEETHSEKGEMSDWRGSSFGVFPGLWTMACD
jgi:hypothetical protein